MSRREGTLKLSSNIEPRASAPLDARLVVPTLADLTASGAFPYPYVGMIVSVQSEGKAYMLTASDPTVSANWTEIGSGSSGDFLETTDELPSVASVDVGKQYFLSADTTTAKKGHVYENNGTKWVDITPLSKYKSISLLTMTGAKYQCITGLKLSGAYLIEINYNMFIVRVLNNFGDQSQKKYGFEIELLGQNLNDTTNASYNYPVYFNNYGDNALTPILAVYVSNGDRVNIQVTQISGAENNDFDFGTFYTSTPPVPFKKSTFYSAASMREAIAPLFNDNKSYNVGDIVWKRVNTDAYDSKPHDNIELYRCIVAHSGSWNSTHFEKIQLCKDFKSGEIEYVEELPTSDITNKLYALRYEEFVDDTVSGSASSTYYDRDDFKANNGTVNMFFDVDDDPTYSGYLFKIKDEYAGKLFMTQNTYGTGFGELFAVYYINASSTLQGDDYGYNAWDESKTAKWNKLKNSSTIYLYDNPNYKKTYAGDEENQETIPIEKPEWTGTHAAWDALSSEEKFKYHGCKVNFTDDDPEDTSSALVGEIRIWAGSTAPNSNYRICNGAALSRTEYAKLFAIIGTAFGAGDGSTTFNIPDLREATTKGVGLTGKSNNHMDADGLALGEFIDDRVQEHNHYINSGASSAGEAEWTMFASSKLISRIGSSSNHMASGRTGDTTEVKAVGVNYIIRVK